MSNPLLKTLRWVRIATVVVVVASVLVGALCVIIAAELLGL